MITDRKSETNDRRRRKIAATSFAAAAFTLTAAACGSGQCDSAGSMPLPSATGVAVSAQATGLGTILVDGQGRTLYQFANDLNNKSTCTDACVANWPYVPAPDSLPADLPGVTGIVGTTTRDDGHHQLTVAGHPSTPSSATPRRARPTVRASISTAVCGLSCLRPARPWRIRARSARQHRIPPYPGTETD